VVITMLPNGAILRAVAAEVLPAMAPGAVLLDCSTVDVDLARASPQAEAAGSARSTRRSRAGSAARRRAR
jgi:3-hydroxyisobutyrate dehydrogenase